MYSPITRLYLNMILQKGYGKKTLDICRRKDQFTIQIRRKDRINGCLLHIMLIRYTQAENVSIFLCSETNTCIRHNNINPLILLFFPLSLSPSLSTSSFHSSSLSPSLDIYLCVYVCVCVCMSLSPSLSPSLSLSLSLSLSPSPSLLSPSPNPSSSYLPL